MGKRTIFSITDAHQGIIGEALVMANLCMIASDRRNFFLWEEILQGAIFPYSTGEKTLMSLLK